MRYARLPLGSAGVPEESRPRPVALGIPFLGEIALHPEVRAGGDHGSPVAARGPDSPEAKSFYDIAKQVAARVSVANLTASPEELVTIRP